MRRKYGIGKKLALIGVLGVGLSVGTAYADSSLQTIYHVYVGDKHVGVVESKKDVQSYLDERVKEAESSYDNLDLHIREDVSYVPEKMFSPDTHDKKVMDALADDVSVSVDAVGLTIGGETVAYLPNQKKADEVVEKLKEEYVKPKTLKKVEERSGKKPELKVGDSTVIDVALTKKVSKNEEEVKPSSIVSVDEAVKLLDQGNSEKKIHTVAKGEVLGEIAGQYDLSTDKIIEMNPDLKKEGTLHIGDQVNVTDIVPLTEVKVREEGVRKETLPHKTKTVKTDDLYKGKTKVKQEGKDGEKKVHYYIRKKNGEAVGRGVMEEEVLSKPKEKIILKGTKVIPSRGTGDFAWPASGGVITSHMGKRWGEFHKGIDIAGVSNRGIKAADNGVVVSAGYTTGGYGNKIVIDHKNGYRTTYAHLKSINVHAGQTVQRGKKIGVMGTTGHSTGVHLHFEIRKNGSLKNPESFY
ncbi:M23 family metallopeptidase [Halobacillus salinarum]|uniref:M23 family metallopeptidase n=1 Tax=Halobacillus salinarum TaxID=2932257 RepID=A0ABY4ELD4_9BACI|nr:M23 family metallopeptidase [Halobacillus salinarum]UOQ44795.1 M23 family metallopeptidase [Halobacillus salinarum]